MPCHNTVDLLFANLDPRKTAARTNRVWQNSVRSRVVISTQTAQAAQGQAGTGKHPPASKQGGGQSPTRSKAVFSQSRPLFICGLASGTTGRRTHQPSISESVLSSLLRQAERCCAAKLSPTSPQAAFVLARTVSATHGPMPQLSGQGLLGQVSSLSAGLTVPASPTTQ